MNILERSPLHWPFRSSRHDITQTLRYKAAHQGRRPPGQWYQLGVLTWAPGDGLPDTLFAAIEDWLLRLLRWLLRAGGRGVKMKKEWEGNISPKSTSAQNQHTKSAAGVGAMGTGDMALWSSYWQLGRCIHKTKKQLLTTWKKSS